MKSLIYRQISFDTTRISPGRNQNVRLFDASSHAIIDGSERVTEINEGTIVRWLMLEPMARALFLEELGFPLEAEHHTEVVRPFYTHGEGDIDLIIYPPFSPHRAIAFECKRVKVEYINSSQDKINKLNGVASGVRQANKLYKGRWGFFQTYLVIITEIDSSAEKETNIPNRGARTHTKPDNGDTQKTTFRQIVEFPGCDDLNINIGILFVDVVQPSRQSFDTRATVRICRYRHSEKRDQSSTVTQNIRKLMRF